MLVEPARLEQEVLGLPWHTILSAPVVAIRPSPCEPREPLVAAVPVFGPWCGWLRLRCDVQIGREIAERLRSPDPVRSWDLDDAARWLAGAVAEVLGPALDRDAKLGAPTLLNAAQPWAPRHCRPVARLCFAAGGHRIGIALDQRIPIVTRDPEA
jgi:hypothetical protein